MKKYIFPLLGVIMLMVSCKPNIENKFSFENPVNKAEVDKIAGMFKAVSDMDFAKLDLDQNVLADMKVWKEEYDRVKVLTNTASKGVAGYLIENAEKPDKKRFVNELGFEPDQLVKKGLIGAFQLKGFNNNLMNAVRAKDAKSRVASLSKGLAYLLGTPKLNKTRDEFIKEGNSFGKYLMSVAKTQKYSGLDKKLYAAIGVAYASASNKEIFNKTLLEINKYAGIVVAMRGVHYIAGYTNKLREEVKAGKVNGNTIHELSEGLGFVYSLQYAYNGDTHKLHYTYEEAKKMAKVDLWKEAEDVSGKSILDQASEDVAKKFGFVVADAL